jgi:hypothetical protein
VVIISSGVLETTPTPSQIVRVLNEHVTRQGDAREPMPTNPFAAIDDTPVIHPYQGGRYTSLATLRVL